MLIVYQPKHLIVRKPLENGSNMVRKTDHLKNILKDILMGIILSISVIAYFSDGEEVQDNEIEITNDTIEISDKETIKGQVEVEIKYEWPENSEPYNPVEEEKEIILLSDLEVTIVEAMAKNLESFIANGRISILSSENFSEDSSEMNTEIVNQMRQGNNVTIYSSSAYDSGPNSIESRSTTPLLDNEEVISEEGLKRGLDERDKYDDNRKKVVIITQPSDHPLPLPSGHIVAEEPSKMNDPEGGEKGRINILQQKAGASKFPFLPEHHEELNLNERIKEGNSKVEDSQNTNHMEPEESVAEITKSVNTSVDKNSPTQDTSDPNKDRDIFMEDEHIGEDIGNLFRENPEIDNNRNQNDHTD